MEGSISNAELNSLIQRLTEGKDRETAKCLITYRQKPFRSFLQANRDGYEVYVSRYLEILRDWDELPPEPEIPKKVDSKEDLPWPHVLHAISGVKPEKDADFKQDGNDKPSTKRLLLSGLQLFLAILGVAALAIVGLIQVVKWILF